MPLKLPSGLHKTNTHHPKGLLVSFAKAQNLPRQKIRLNIMFKSDPQGTIPSCWWRAAILKRSWGEKRHSLFALSWNSSFHLQKDTSQTFSCQKILPRRLEQQGQKHLIQRDALSHFNCRQNASLKSLDLKKIPYRSTKQPRKVQFSSFILIFILFTLIKVQEWCEIFRPSCNPC